MEGRKQCIRQVYAPQRECREKKDTPEEEFRILDEETGLLTGDISGRVGEKRRGIGIIIGTF